jgi:hypothetical protein
MTLITMMTRRYRQPMGIDHDWVRLRELIQAGLDDRQVLVDPPQSEQEWGFFADTLCDRLYAEVKRLTGGLTLGPDGGANGRPPRE